MCCSEEHYPKDAGIWRTDACGEHIHYGEHVEGRAFCPGPNSEHHWHAVTPVRITACLTYDLNHKTIALKAQDWFRLDREDSMAASGKSPQRGTFDLVASLKFPDVEETSKGVDLILLAIAEGYDWSHEKLQQIVPRAKIHFAPGGRELYPPATPTYEEWKRWNSFIKPAHNDALYDADFGHSMKFSGLDREIAIVDGEFDIEAWHNAMTPDKIVETQIRRARGLTNKAAPTASGWKPLEPTVDDIADAQRRLLESLGLGDDA